MTKIDIISGFLGAGKTTLIKKLLSEALVGEKVVLIENEFGEIGIDGGFLKDSGIEITEMNSGCICCTLVGDFEKSLSEVLDRFSPDRVVIEPSGVGKLSDIISAVEKLGRDDISLNSFSTVVDAKKCKMYLKNFGEFFCNQVENARAIILSRSQDATEEKLAETIELIRGLNDEANIITTPWDSLDGKQILNAMETAKLLSKELEEVHHKVHEHHHHEHGEECDCHEHHHHEHGEECHCHEHHHHDADEVFTAVGFETIKKYSLDEINAILRSLADEETYGIVLRSKGIVSANDGWIHFDYVPKESDVRKGRSETIGKICVIGSNLNEDKIKELFRV